MGPAVQTKVEQLAQTLGPPHCEERLQQIKECMWRTEWLMKVMQSHLRLAPAEGMGGANWMQQFVLIDSEQSLKGAVGFEFSQTLEKPLIDSMSSATRMYAATDWLYAQCGAAQPE